MALILTFRGVTPSVAPDVFLAPTAVIIGDVRIDEGASVWFGAVLRGDHPDHGIHIGRGSSVQDNCVVHVGGWGPTVVGPECTIGHGAKFESCSIGRGCIVGMNAVILQQAVIGEQSVVAAGSVVLERSQIPPRSLVAGVPATVKKELEGSAAEWVERGARHYMELSREYRMGGAEPTGSSGEGERGDDGAR